MMFLALTLLAVCSIAAAAATSELRVHHGFLSDEDVNWFLEQEARVPLTDHLAKDPNGHPQSRVPLTIESILHARIRAAMMGMSVDEEKTTETCSLVAQDTSAVLTTFNGTKSTSHVDVFLEVSFH